MVQWKSLKGLVENGDNYEVSTSGFVRNATTGRVLKGQGDGHGYLQVTLALNKKHRRYRVHRLVALAFVPNPDNKPLVNHDDGNQHNNCYSNLVWATNQENLKHAFDNGIAKAKQGEESNNATLSNSQVAEIKKLLMERKPQHEIAKLYGVKPQTIRYIQHGKLWTHVHVEGFKTFKSGVNKPNLTADKVLKIREAYATGKYKQAELCKMFDVSSRSMTDLINRKTWKHI